MNPSDLLGHLLQRLDSDLAEVDVVTADEVSDWPDNLMHLLLREQILQPAPSASTVMCNSCCEDHVEQVQEVESTPGSAPHYYITCPRYGREQVDPDSLHRWRIDGSGLAKTVAGLLNCQDRCRELTRVRLWSLGVAKLQGKARDVFLLRGIGWSDAGQALVMEDPSLFLDSSIVFSPAQPGPYSAEQLPLVPLHRVTTLTDGGLKLDCRKLTAIHGSITHNLREQKDRSGIAMVANASSVAESPNLDIPNVTLSPQEEEEFQRWLFNGAFPVEITGAIANRASNVVRIAGAQVIVSDAEFVLLLRLVVALYETEDGYVARGDQRGGGLVDEGIYPPDSVDPATGRLRSRLQPALRGLNPNKYIQVQRKRVRLSTHRRYIQVDRRRLLNHPNARIQDLAARLPENQGLLANVARG